MFSFLKNLIHRSDKKKNYNPQLYERFYALAYDEGLNELFFSSVNKLYILNTYTSSFHELLANLFNPNFTRQLNAVNVHSYFNRSRDDLKIQFMRFPELIRDNKINHLIEKDLMEICETYEYFLSLKKDHHGK
jgi:hypothetical protein